MVNTHVHVIELNSLFILRQVSIGSTFSRK